MFEHVRSLPGERAPEQHTNGGGHDNHDRIGGQTHWPGTTAIVDADRAGRRIVEGILRIRLILMVIVASHGRPFPYAVQTSVGSNIPSRGIPGRSHKGHRTRIPAADVHALRSIAARSLELHERARVET